jgi:kynureninase
MTVPSLAEAQRLDAADPLAGFRDRFDIPDGLIYLDGNSLGVLPKATAGKVEDVVRREWGQDLIRSWNKNDWINAPRRLGDKIGALIGAAPGQVVAGDTTSINVFKALSAAVQMRPERTVLLSETGNFPTDVYMMEGLSALSGGRLSQKLVERGELMDALDETVAVLLLTHTHYKTGEVFDMAAVTEAAHAKGVLTIWDLSHSCGALPVELDAARADFAVGCGYKYLNGGPGAPGFIYAAQRHQDGVFPALSGWLGHASPFAFSDDYAPAPGIDRFQCGTPGILGMAALEVGLDLMSEADMAEIRRKSMALGDFFIAAVETLTEGFGLSSPREGAKRGSQVSLTHADGFAIMQAMIDRGVIGDFRAPNILRFGFTPLYVRYEDVWTAAQTLADVMAESAWDKPEFKQMEAVT